MLIVLMPHMTYFMTTLHLMAVSVLTKSKLMVLEWLYKFAIDVDKIFYQEH